MTAATDWGLWVNELGVSATGIAAGRWADFLLRAGRERLTMLAMTPCGGEYHVMCGTKADAEEARETFTDIGFHPKHVRVARLSACQAKARERRERTGWPPVVDGERP
jgi:hypothetical protein